MLLKGFIPKKDDVVKGENRPYDEREGEDDMKDGRQIVEKLKTLQSAAFVAVGWGLLAAWADLLGHSTGFAVPYSGLTTLGNMRVYWLAGLLLLSVFMALAPHWFERVQRSVAVFMPLAASFGTMVFAVSVQQQFFPVEMVAVIGIVVSGAGYAWFTCLLCTMLAETQRMVYAAGSIVAGLVLKTIFVQIFTMALSESLQVGLAILLPLAVALCAFFARKGTVTLVENDEWKPVSPGVSGYRYLVPQIAVAAIGVATVRVITPLGFFGDPLNLFAGMLSSTLGMVGVCAAMMALSYFTLAKRMETPLNKRFVPAFLVVIFAFFVTGFSGSLQGVVAAAAEVFVTATELLAHALFWTIVVTAIRLKDTSPFRVVGLATGFYDALSIAWVAFFFSLGVVNSAIILVVAFVLVLVLIWLIDRSEDVGPVVPPNMMVDRRADLAEGYGLSPRETEVFMMLAQGRSRSYISEDLVLSEGTIKTHISHIYTKLGVGNRQEMFDLLLQSADAE
ncbi:helix-turn-helix transcriptional regulator, partial [Gordonibacter sp.]